MKKKTALGLVILGAAAYLSRGVIRGTAFAMQLTALICWMAALILWLTGPFESPRMKRFSHIMLTLIAACAAAGLVSFVWIEGLIFGGRAGVPMDDADILIVLGAGLWGDQPSPMLTNRLETTLDYLDKHPGCIAVLSGGQGSDELRTEASAMAAWLEARGDRPLAALPRRGVPQHGPERQVLAGPDGKRGSDRQDRRRILRVPPLPRPAALHAL